MHTNILHQYWHLTEETRMPLTKKLFGLSRVLWIINFTMLTGITKELSRRPNFVWRSQFQSHLNYQLPVILSKS